MTLLQTVVNAEQSRRHSNASIDMKLEVIVIPVSNVDRAKEFYTRLGGRLDANFAGNNGLRLVQFTPPGSGSSVQFCVNLTPATPGLVQGQLSPTSMVPASNSLRAASRRARFFIVQKAPAAGFQASRTA